MLPKYPMGQGEHTVAPLREKVPAGQAESYRDREEGAQVKPVLHSVTDRPHWVRVRNWDTRFVMVAIQVGSVPVSCVPQTARYLHLPKGRHAMISQGSKATTGAK